MSDPTGRPLTIGVEEEFQILCPETMALVPAYERLAGASSGLLIKSELHQSCGELITRPCDTVSELVDAVRINRLRLAELAECLGLRVALSGTHPFSDWKELPITREERRLYSEYLFQEAHRHCLAFALHIHVGVPDRRLALRVMNDARSLLPIIYALSCSSPFLEGRATGLRSSRLLRAFGFPRTGIPDAFPDLEQYEQLVETMQLAGLILDAGQLWWDIRIHHSYPTVEFRICDAVPLLQDVGALAGLTQAFVARLLDLYESGESPPRLDRVLLCENRWRAARFGAAAELLDYDTLSLRPLGELLNDLCDRLAPWARRLQLSDRLRQAVDIAARGTAADRQLALWQSRNAPLQEVVKQYATETLQVEGTE